MARTIEVTLCKFDELSDCAKERARAWYREGIDASEITDGLSDDWQSVAKLIGVELKERRVPLMNGTTRSDIAIYWSAYPAGAAFDGWYRYAKGAPKAIRAHAPLDADLHRIADGLQVAQRVAFYSIDATCQAGVRNSTTQIVNASSERGDYARQCDDVSDLLRDFAHWIARQIEVQYEFLHSDGYADETLTANEYEFTESGEVA